MQSRRDQVQAHRFAVSRLNSAMQLTDPDAVETPLGRTSRNLIVGTTLALIGAIGAFVFGLLVPGGSGSGWKKDGTLVQDSTTGAQFLYLASALHPMANYASARLLEGDKLVVSKVSWSSLAGVPRGTAIGITGAPQELPAAEALSTAPWQVCSVRQPTTTGSTAMQTVLQVATSSDATPLDSSQSLLAAGTDGHQYLLWNGRRYRLPGTAAVLQALGYGSVTPYQVSGTFLNAIPAGPDLAAPQPAGEGYAGPSLGGPTRVGQLFVVHSAGAADQFYQLRSDGLVPVTPFTADLIQADPATRRLAYRGRTMNATPLDAATVGSHMSSAASPTGEFPNSPPGAATLGAGDSACIRVAPHGGNPSIGVVVASSSVITGSVPAVGGTATPACTTVDFIGITPGRGVLAQALPTAGSQTTLSSYLVTDEGVKYPLTTAEAVQNLGYAAAKVSEIPDSLLSLLPTGPALDPTVVLTGSVASGAVRGPGPNDCSTGQHSNSLSGSGNGGGTSGAGTGSRTTTPGKKGGHA